MNLRLLGVDPGSRITGFGIIQLENRQHRYLSSGCIRTEGGAMAGRLQEIFRGLNQLIQEFQPEMLAIEKVFMHRNADAALKLGQARGAAIVAATNANLPVHEYTPNEIKQAVVGHGHADKAQVQHMVRVLLNLPGTPQADAADALAVALCHAQTMQYQQHVPYQ